MKGARRHSGNMPGSPAMRSNILPALGNRRHFIAFVAGCLLVTAGVLLHLPMYWMGRGDGFRLVDMPMDAEMLWGMAAILVGAALAAWGLLPTSHLGARQVDVAVPEEAPLGRAHWRLMVVLTAALVIDVMKPASLGFVLPGMRAEYELDALTVAWLPFSALCGTVLGSIVWGVLADVFGRRASILLSSVFFVGTSICGAMPSLGWNIFMCFLMGAAAGGMLPVTYALLAETMPAKQRGWVLVLVGGLGAVGGYLVASLAAAWIEPIFSWRALWFLNLPTGLLLIALSVFIPESPRFLLRIGRREEARATLARFGSTLREQPADTPAPVRPDAAHPVLPMTGALSVGGLASGLIQFGVLLWLPAHLVSQGHSFKWSSTLLAASAFFALPTVLLAAWLYGRWTSKGALLGAMGLAAAGLAGVIVVANGEGSAGAWLASITLLVIGSNAILAMLLPYAAESYPAATRGRAVGWIAACSKLGGPVAQGLTLLGLVPALGAAAVVTAGATVAALGLIGRFCVETREREVH
jgi:MFS transporter, putative metabolite:H+ symporter